MDNDIILITAYKDIGRNTLLVYIENNIREQLLMEYTFNTDNIIFKDYHSVDTYLNKYLKNDKIIMSNNIYKDKILIPNIIIL